MTAHGTGKRRYVKGIGGLAGRRILGGWRRGRKSIRRGLACSLDRGGLPARVSVGMVKTKRRPGSFRSRAFCFRSRSWEERLERLSALRAV